MSDQAAHRAPGRVSRRGLACGAAAAVAALGTGTFLVVGPHDGESAAETVSGLDPITAAAPDGARQAERLDRGVVAVQSGDGALVSWRLLGGDTMDTAFHVYRDGTLLTPEPLTGATNLLDEDGDPNAEYTVAAVEDGEEQAESAPSLAFTDGFLDIPLDRPEGGSVEDSDYTYQANDASIGDLNGDGEYELVLKWDPTNSQDNAHSGHTGPVLLDAYTLDGDRLWRVDLGPNIRAGAHYTQFQVYDYDGDGAAELAVKTADGTVDGEGGVIGDAGADHSNGDGYILDGPEFLTIFAGDTGAALDTVDYVPERGNVADWGDDYGNRVDRFLAGTAYLDGERPSMVFSRGYYTRAVIAAWDFRDGELTQRWVFDSDDSGNGDYAGQGFHSLSVADADGDGRDEIMFGAAAIDDDGTGLWNTDQGHGDALHVGDFLPEHDGLEVYGVGENSDRADAWIADAATGEIIWESEATTDNGRGVAADVWPGNPGAEFWSSAVDGMRNGSGDDVGREPGSTNFLAWWDGDTSRELLDGTAIDKYGTDGDERLLTGEDVASNNGTKSTPVLSGDILGDWREEVVWRTEDDSALRVYSTSHETEERMPTLVHDTQYRVALAWQNTAYNQPPHPSFAIGDGMPEAPWPDIHHP